MNHDIQGVFLAGQPDASLRPVFLQVELVKFIPGVGMGADYQIFIIQTYDMFLLRIKDEPPVEDTVSHNQ